jgi:hypothetical protein
MDGNNTNSIFFVLWVSPTSKSICFVKNWNVAPGKKFFWHVQGPGFDPQHHKNESMIFAILL